jgi:hypothetical protein
MPSAFLIPGFSPDRTFADPSLDALKVAMIGRDIQLYGVTDGWNDNGIKSLGERAIEQYQHNTMQWNSYRAFLRCIGSAQRRWYYADAASHTLLTFCSIC